MPDFLSEVKKIRPIVKDKVIEYLPLKNEPIDHYNMVCDYSLRGGKYLRPALLIYSGYMFGAPKEKLLVTAAAVELSEDWLLIHDDAQDHSLERRSTPNNYMPTLNTVYGEELAVNAGNAVHLLVWRALADNFKLLGTMTSLEVFTLINEYLLKTVEGQFMELSWIKNHDIDISAEEYLAMVERKTCFYTTLAPLQLGAIIAGYGSKKILSEIAAFGVPFGYAFQIWDDVMNLTMDSKKQGKERGGDILEGKRTLILSHLMEHCNQLERGYIRSIYNKRRTAKTEAEKEYVIRKMENYGSINYAKKMAKDYSKKALEELSNFNHAALDYKYKEVIKSAIEFVVNRSR